MKIEVFGTGCAKCERLERNVLNALTEKGMDADVEKVTDPDEMVSKGIMMTPALMIDGELVVAGRVATIKEINDILDGL